MFHPNCYRWFDVGLLMLSDPSRNINLKSFTQMTFIPLSIITSLQNDTPQDYDKRETGFAVTIGAAMSRSLDVSFINSRNTTFNNAITNFPQTPHYEWHKTYTSIDRIDMIINAAKSLASIYKLEIDSKKEPADVAQKETK